MCIAVSGKPVAAANRCRTQQCMYVSLWLYGWQTYLLRMCNFCYGQFLSERDTRTNACYCYNNGLVVHCWNPETEVAKKLRYLRPQYGQELKIKGHKSGIGTEELYVSKSKYYGGMSFLEGLNATGKPSPTISNLEVLHTYRDSAGNTTEEKSIVFSLITLLSSRTYVVWAVKLYSNKIIQFLTAVLANTGWPI